MGLSVGRPRCPSCGRFAADGENKTPYGSEQYLWCSACQKFVPDKDALARLEGDDA